MNRNPNLAAWPQAREGRGARLMEFADKRSRPPQIQQEAIAARLSGAADNGASALMWAKVDVFRRELERTHPGLSAAAVRMRIATFRQRLAEQSLGGR